MAAVYVGWIPFVLLKQIEVNAVTLMCGIGAFLGFFHGMRVGLMHTIPLMAVMILIWRIALWRRPEWFRPDETILAAAVPTPRPWWNAYRLISLLGMLGMLIILALLAATMPPASADG